METERTHSDVKAKVESKKWFYTDTVKKHFFDPENLLKTEEEATEYEKTASGVGQVGSPACGDMMKIWIRVNDDDTITGLKVFRDNLFIFCIRNF